MPSNADAERIVIASALMDGSTVSRIAEALDASDFYSSLHRQVFAAMVKLHSADKPIEAVLIADEIRADGSDVLASTVANIAIGIPYFADIEDYIEKVRHKAAIRKLVKTFHSLTQKALSGEADETIFADAQSQVSEICAGATGTDEYFPSLRKVMETEVFQALDDLRSGQVRKIKTGFGMIDEIIGGIALSDVMLIAADTGAGKSALALQMLYNITNQGLPSAFLAGEMTNKENVLRLLSQVSGVTNLNWLSRIEEQEYAFLMEWAQAIIDRPIYWEHKISDLATLRTHLHTLVKVKGVKVVVVDYIQLFKLERVDKRTRNERIAEASQELKRIANELGVAIIEVAQFNREGAKKEEATLHDLEGSGQLEKDASMILILSLSEAKLWNQTHGEYREAKIRIVKGRNVGTGTITGKFYGKSVRFDFD